MLKPAFITILSLFIFYSVRAQSDTAVYYVQKDGRQVGSKDSADYYMLVYPSRAVSETGLFVVKEFYKNGKVKSSGLSHNNTMRARLEGTYTAWFANGNKMFVKHYTDGAQDGGETWYYPNGNLYYSKTLNAGRTQYNECRDSTGKVLAANGNGKWIAYPAEGFSGNKIEGQVVNRRQEGEWTSRVNDSLSLTTVYQNGEQKAMYQIGGDGQRTYYMPQTIPEFPGGAEAFGQFLGKNIVYPILARQNNTHGRVIITFVVDEQGKLTNIKVARGIGSGCDEEAVRVLKLSPVWSPGMVDNKPVRVQYSVPISFTLGK